MSASSARCHAVVSDSKERIALHRSGKTQVAYADRGGNTYTLISAHDLANAMRSDLENRKNTGDTTEEKHLRREIRASHCAGKQYTVGILIAQGEELSFHCQWKHTDHRSYFARLPRREAPEESLRTLTDGATPVPHVRKTPTDVHGLAISVLKDAINARVTIQFTSKCWKRHHILELFTTNETMYASEEVLVSNQYDQSVRIDLAVYRRGDDRRPLFCIEVFNTHKSVHGSRDGVLWCEVVASRILDTFDHFSADKDMIVIPCEPRDDAKNIQCEACDAVRLRSKLCSIVSHWRACVFLRKRSALAQWKLCVEQTRDVFPETVDEFPETNRHAHDGGASSRHQKEKDHMWIQREAAKAKHAARITGVYSKGKRQRGLTEREYERQKSAASHWFRAPISE